MYIYRYYNKYVNIHNINFMYDYCNKYVNIHNFKKIDVGNF